MSRIDRDQRNRQLSDSLKDFRWIQERFHEENHDTDEYPEPFPILKWIKISFFVFIAAYFLPKVVKFVINKSTNRSRIEHIKKRVLFNGLYEKACVNNPCFHFNHSSGDESCFFIKEMCSKFKAIDSQAKRFDGRKICVSKNRVKNSVSLSARGELGMEDCDKTVDLSSPSYSNRDSIDARKHFASTNNGISNKVTESTTGTFMTQLPWTFHYSISCQIGQAYYNCSHQSTLQSTTTNLATELNAEYHCNLVSLFNQMLSQKQLSNIFLKYFEEDYMTHVQEYTYNTTLDDDSYSPIDTSTPHELDHLKYDTSHLSVDGVFLANNSHKDQFSNHNKLIWNYIPHFFMHICYRSSIAPTGDSYRIASLLQTLLKNILTSKRHFVSESLMSRLLEEAKKSCTATTYSRTKEWFNHYFNQGKVKSIQNISRQQSNNVVKINKVQLHTYKGTLYSLPHSDTTQTIEVHSNLQYPRLICYSYLPTKRQPTLCFINDLSDSPLIREHWDHMSKTFNSVLRMAQISHLHIEAPSSKLSMSHYYDHLYEYIFPFINSISILPHELYHFYHQLREKILKKKFEGHLKNWPTLAKSLMTEDTPSVDVVMFAITSIFSVLSNIQRLHFISPGIHILVTRSVSKSNTSNSSYAAHSMLQSILSISSLSALLHTSTWSEEISIADEVNRDNYQYFDLFEYAVVLKKRERNNRSQFKSDKYRLPNISSVYDIVLTKSILSWKQKEEGLEITLSPVLYKSNSEQSKSSSNFQKYPLFNRGDNHLTYIQTLVSMIELQNSRANPT